MDKRTPAYKALTIHQKINLRGHLAEDIMREGEGYTRYCVSISIKEIPSYLTSEGRGRTLYMSYRTKYYQLQKSRNEV